MNEKGDMIKDKSQDLLNLLIVNASKRWRNTEEEKEDLENQLRHQLAKSKPD